MHKVENSKQRKDTIGLAYAGREVRQSLPKYAIPAEGMEARTAYRVIRDELNFDGNPALNLASFVTTWMEPEADKLALDTLNKNFIDQDEYPQTAEIHKRVISMLGNLFNAPADAEAIGTITVGSSEAIMLALLAHKWNWRKRRAEAGLPADKPNVVFGADVHTCWEKFARYFDVEQRLLPMSDDSHILTVDQVREAIDENTIAVGCVVGTTFTGQVDPVEEIDAMLREVKATKGWDIPIHVDGASGGFVVPFILPDLKWDFRLEQVRSINVSNHKFGLVYPGLGSVVFRDRSVLPEELVFDITYLGGHMPNYSLNFSRESSMVYLQYYNFLRLGMDGYRRIMEGIMENARYLEEQLLQLGCFELLTDSKCLPVVVVELKGEQPFTVYTISEELRKYGWIIPAYPLPANAHTDVIRMVVKENFSRDMAEILCGHMREVIERLGKAAAPAPKAKAKAKKGHSHRHRGVC